MTFSDIFKSSFLEKVSSFSFLDTAVALALSFAVGLFILFIYRKAYRGVMYSQSFATSLMGLTMVTSLVILAVTSNIILSLGMVGALSIVRFRTAVKEAMDIVFLFWAIGVGIVIGAGLIPLAVFGSILIGLILWLFSSRKVRETPYILVLSCEDDEAEKRAMAVVTKSTTKFSVKSKSVSAASGIETTTEIRIGSTTTAFVNEIAKIPGVKNAVLVSYNGEYAS